jgi:polyhydroxyalkanoate synthesis repressor PhaR
LQCRAKRPKLNRPFDVQLHKKGTAMAEGTLVIKKYGNRRLYDTEASSYITLEDLARLIKAGRDVKVIDAKTSQDLTKSVLLQIISEQEKDQDLLPVSFLKKMIQIGDSSLRDGLRRYLSVSLETFLGAQKEFEQRYKDLAGTFLNLNPMLWMMPQLGQLAGQPGQPAAPQPPSEAPPEQGAAPPPEEPGPEAAPAEGPDDAAQQRQIQALRAQVEQIQQLLTKLAK